MKRIHTLSQREKVLTRLFRQFVTAERYTLDEYHTFCKDCKGHSESQILRILHGE